MENRLHSTASVAFALVVLTAIALPPLPASAAGEVLYPARIAFQGEPFPDFTDMDVYKSAVKKALTTKALTKDASGDWAFHFVAFLDRRKARGVSQINLAFFRKGKLVDFVQYAVDPAAKVLLAEATLRKQRGFAPGDKISAKVTVLRRRGKRDIEVVLASTRRAFVLR